MPKINVYLPDDLAEAVRAAGLPVSPICQQALAQALRMVEAARAGIEVIRDPGFDPGGHPRISGRIAARMTPRLHEAIRLARVAAGPGEYVDTRHLLAGVLDEADNLGTRLLEALGVDLAALRAAAARAGSGEQAPGTEDQQDARARVIAEAAAAIAAERSGPAAGDASADRAGTTVWDGLTVPARLVVAGALEAVVDLGHNYIGCEHLLLALAGQDDSETAGLLRSAGADPASLRQAITTATAGSAQARQAAPTLAARLDDVVRRLEEIEGRLAAGGL
jgi:ATP-dependent Clp protease ATP-binding subunit ClpA